MHACTHVCCMYVCMYGVLFVVPCVVHVYQKFTPVCVSVAAVNCVAMSL